MEPQPTPPINLSEEDLNYINSIPEAKGYVDCHNHLYAEEFSKDLPETIQKAIDNNILAMIVVAENNKNFEEILNLQEKYPNFIFPCLGYHPVQGDYNNADEAASLSKEMHISHDENFTFIEQAYKDNKIVGIGEAGLDFTPKFVKKGEIDKNSQKEALIMQLNLAEKLNLPINLHSRSAGRPLMNIINEHENKKFHNIPCQFHAFAGKASLPNNFIKNDKNSNCYFSVGTSRIDLSPSKIEKKTSVRYKPNENFKFISGIPIRNLLLETDLPALGPVRGLRNEPENLLLAAEAVGKVFNLPMNKVRNLTSFNACKLYPKLRSVLF